LTALFKTHAKDRDDDRGGSGEIGISVVEDDGQGMTTMVPMDPLEFISVENDDTSVDPCAGCP
jgi:hypothetical protein